MAKSLRSKSKRAARTLKRQLIFAPVEDDRLKRLAIKQAVVQDKEMNQDSTMCAESSLSKNAIKKLAMSNHQIYKKNKAKQNKAKKRK